VPVVPRGGHPHEQLLRERAHFLRIALAHSCSGREFCADRRRRRNFVTTSRGSDLDVPVEIVESEPDAGRWVRDVSPQQPGSAPRRS
jgi:hypothetical protein